MALVVDASTVVAWFVASQATPYSERILKRAAAERLHAPALLHVELASVLVKLAHRRRLEPQAVTDILLAFEALDVVTDKAAPTARTLAVLCQQHGLSAYDATYFELATRIKVPLAASDAVLARVAKGAGIFQA